MLKGTPLKSKNYIPIFTQLTWPRQRPTTSNSHGCPGVTSLCAIKSNVFQHVKSFCSRNRNHQLTKMKFLILIASMSVVVLAASTVAYTPSRYFPGQRRQQPSSAVYRTPPQPSYRSAQAPATVVRNLKNMYIYYYATIRTQIQ